MTNNDQAAAVNTAATKSDWVKPEIVSFTPAVEAQGGSNKGNGDAGTGTNFS